MIEACCIIPGRDAAHWSYAASVTAGHLTSVARSGRTDPTAFPEGVRISLIHLLQEAIEACEDDRPCDARTVAQDALDASLHPPPRKPADVRTYLRIIADVLTACGTSQRLTEAQRGYARKAIAFFQAIVRAGDSADAHRAFTDDYLDELEFA